MDRNFYRWRKFVDEFTTSNNVITECRQFKTDREHFTYALKAVLHYQTDFLCDSERTQKSTQHSVRLRENGNKSFTTDQYDKAVKEYTESIVYAADSSAELALAYANRSAALFKLKKYADCIADIDRALNQNYPDELKTKLYKRKGSCLMALGKPGAVSAFKKALVWLDKLNLNEGAMNKSRSELIEMISTPYTAAKPPVKVKEYPVPKILTPNSEIPCASDAVTIKYSKKFGRHLVATRKLKPGEILVIEKPYCTNLMDKNVYTHCSYCLKQSWNLIPCQCCVNVTYCSESCKNTALDEYHEVECLIFRLLFDFDINEIMLVGIRMAMIATQKGTKLNALKQELVDVDRNTDPRTKGFGNDEKFHSDRFRSIYSLSNNADKCAIGQLVRAALSVALAVCTLAKESEIFGKKLSLDKSTKNPDVIFLGELILKNFHMCNTNMHSLGISLGETCDYAGGLMPFLSLLNHSCDPNTMRVWDVDRMVLYAMHPIEQGEQIFDNYGPVFTSVAKSERHQALKPWYFNCECLACRKDWPLLGNVPSYKEQSLTQSDEHKLAKILKNLEIIFKSLILKYSKKTMMHLINELLKAIEELFKLAKKPCQELYLLIGIMQQFYDTRDTIFDYVLGSRGYGIESGLPSFYVRLYELLSKN